MDPLDRISKYVENEVVFRTANEQVQKDLDAFTKIAADEHEEPITINANVPIHFLCECSDEDCKKRIKLTPKAYKQAHKQRDMFTIICGHEVEDLEDVIETTDEYCVIKKRLAPPASADYLKPTDLHNT